jgi:branched-chain amino acid transport system ATP-binding protein
MMTMSALAVRSVSKSFGGLTVLSDISLEIAVGERHLLLGPNGAGKTTLFKVMAGELKPTGGTIHIDGKDVTRQSPNRRVELGLSRSFQILTLFAQDTFRHNLTLALLAGHRERWGMVRRLSALTDIRERAERVLEELGLEGYGDRIVDQCSYGERRRLEIALAVASRPRVLLLDEPYAGLSAPERESVRSLIDRIATDVAIVLIEHDMDVALSFAQRITVLHHGRIIASGSREEVLADARTQEVYLGA